MRCVLNRQTGEQVWKLLTVSWQILDIQMEPAGFIQRHQHRLRWQASLLPGAGALVSAFCLSPSSFPPAATPAVKICPFPAPLPQLPFLHSKVAAVLPCRFCEGHRLSLPTPGLVPAQHTRGRFSGWGCLGWNGSQRHLLHSLPDLPEARRAGRWRCNAGGKIRELLNLGHQLSNCAYNDKSISLP